MAEQVERWRVRTPAGEVIGPYDQEELRRLLSGGQLTWDAKARSETTGRIHPLREIISPASVAPGAGEPEPEATAEHAGEPPREVIAAIDRLLPSLGRQWAWMFLCTFSLPLGFVVALAYWALGWFGSAHCTTARGMDASEAVIRTGQNWLVAWAFIPWVVIIALVLAQFLFAATFIHSLIGAAGALSPPQIP